MLLDKQGFPIAVLEAKSEKYDPLIGKEQARRYAQSQNVRFVILSNGNLHYFWDLQQGNPTLITEFPNPESIKSYHAFNPNPDDLAVEMVEEDYIALTQNPNYRNDPRWADAGQREAFLKDTQLKFLRPYQIRAVAALQEAVSKGQTRFLFEMATGTGKTLTAAAGSSLHDTGNAKRPALTGLNSKRKMEAFVRLLKNDFIRSYKENRDDWRKDDRSITVQKPPVQR